MPNLRSPLPAARRTGLSTALSTAPAAALSALGSAQLTLQDLPQTTRTLLGREFNAPIETPEDAIRSGEAIGLIAPSVHGGERSWVTEHQRMPVVRVQSSDDRYDASRFFAPYGGN